MSTYFAGMSDLELVGHVNAITDASELSMALAVRVKSLVQKRDDLARELGKTKQALLALQLGIAEDKLDAYQELAENA